MKENIFFTDEHQIGETHKPIKPIQKMKRGAKVDELKDIKDIASALRDYVKKKYPKCKFAVNIERFSGGQALRINWFQADFNPLVSEEAWGDTKEGKRYTINENYIKSDKKLTPKAKSVLQDVVDFYEQYNYDFSEPQSDYYNVRFYTSVYVGTWNKPFEQIMGKPASKPTGGTEQGIEPPMFSDGQSVIYKTSQGDKDGTIEYSKYVKSQKKYIYGVKTPSNAILTIWESNISSNTETPEIPQPAMPQPETPLPEAPSPETDIDEEAVKELDQELILINELRNEEFAQTNLEAQKEFRDELTELIGARDIFTLGEFNFQKSIQTYFERISEPVNFESNDQEQINKRTELIANYVKTNAFKNWFGDWQNSKYPCSQAVKIDPISDKRVPLIVYHGTQNPEHFTRFKTDRFPIIYFAENPKYAQWFADLGNGKIFECFLDIRFPVDFRPLQLQEITWQQLSIFLKDTYGIILPTFPDLTEKRKVWQWIRFDGERNFALLNAIKNANFDSMIHVENNPQQIDENGNEEITDAYMIFDTKRAKLVKYAYNVTSATTLLFLKKGGLLDLKREIKSL